LRLEISDRQTDRQTDTGQTVIVLAVTNIVQEAQLSQRDRAMLHVIEYFAKSLKFIRNDTVE